MNDETERELIARFQSGDQSAFGELFEAHHRRVLHSALQVIRDQETALDVAQEVFLRAFEELRYWRGEARLSTWLYRTALNVSFECIRAEERRRRFHNEAAQTETAPSPESMALEGEVMAAIDHAVQRLPPRQRVIFSLRQYEGLQFTVIAELLDITEAGAKAGYHKALLTLQRWLRHVAPETPAACEKACVSNTPAA